MHPCDVWICIEAFWEENNRVDQQEWERTRFLAYMIHLHSRAKKKISSIESFLPLPTDTTKSQQQQTWERIQAYREATSKLPPDQRKILN